MAIPSWHFYLKHTLFNVVSLGTRRSSGWVFLLYQPVVISPRLKAECTVRLCTCHKCDISFPARDPPSEWLLTYNQRRLHKKERKNPLWIITAATSSPSCTNHFQFAGHGADGVTVGLVFSVYSLDMLQVHNILCSRDNAQLIETVLNSHYSQVKKKKLF